MRLCLPYLLLLLLSPGTGAQRPLSAYEIVGMYNNQARTMELPPIVVLTLSVGTAGLPVGRGRRYRGGGRPPVRRR